MDPLRLVARLVPGVAECRVVLGETRISVYDSSPPSRGELQRSFLDWFWVVVDNNRVVPGTTHGAGRFAGLGFCG